MMTTVSHHPQDKESESSSSGLQPPLTNTSERESGGNLQPEAQLKPWPNCHV